MCPPKAEAGSMTSASPPLTDTNAPSIEDKRMIPSDSPLSTALRAGDTHAAALTYRSLGLSTIPVKVDGSKAPAFCGWREFAERLPTVNELETWHSDPNRYGIGLTGGTASGNFAVFDFELWNLLGRWGGALANELRDPLARCPVVNTPGNGAHVYCRLAEPVEGC